MSEQNIQYEISKMIDRCADEGGYDPVGDVILDNFCREVVDLLAEVGARIADLERQLAETKDAIRYAEDDFNNVSEKWAAATRRAEEAEGAVKASNQLLLDIGEAIRELPASDGRVIGMVYFLAHIDKCVAGPKKGEVANG